MDTKVVGANIDTFIGNARINQEFPELLVAQLEDLKRRSQEAEEDVPSSWRFAGEILFIKPHGAGRQWRWMERIAEKEVDRITAKCRRYQDHGKAVPAWIRAGMDERFRRVAQIEQRVQMLLGVFASHSVLPLEFKPAYSVGDLLLQHLEALEQEAEEKGGVQQMLADHFAKVYKVNLPVAA